MRERDGILLMKEKLDVLVSCMHQTDIGIINKSRITGNAVVINQCDRDGFCEMNTENGRAVMYSTTQRGLTKSRNMAVLKSDADICLLCDDDEIFESSYEKRILRAYEKLPQADVIIFKMSNRTPSFEDKVKRLGFPEIMKVSSWQISFRREKILSKKVGFDELLGAGTGNGGEEELKFLLDCIRAGLKVYYVPEVIASVGQTSSTWFNGFDERFFINRGNTTRYILGFPVACAYGIYYVIRKRKLYGKDISSLRALRCTFKGIFENRITKMKKAVRVSEG